MENGPFTFKIIAQPQTAKRGAAEKIADMFTGMEETSFLRHIAPVILDEFAYRELDAGMCVRASEEIDRALDIASCEGYAMKCVPQFKPTIDGTMQLYDLIYKRTEKW